MTYLKQAIRQTLVRPAISVVVVLLLAIGIGAPTAMFSLYHQILLRPLPVPQPDRLVNLRAPGLKFGPSWAGEAIADGGALFSYAMYRDLDAKQQVFAGLAAHTDFSANLGYRSETSTGSGMLISGNYFEVLNLAPALGRLLRVDDAARPGESAVVVLSYDYWQRQFGGDRSIINESLTVNGRELTIVGVAPPSFAGNVQGFRPDVYVPFTLRWVMQPTVEQDTESRQSFWLYLFARLNPGVRLEQADSALNTIYSGILAEIEAPLLTSLPDEQRTQFLEKRIELVTSPRGWSPVSTETADPLTLLLAVTAVVLLIACVNIANLLLERGASRREEMAIRFSIGATRTDLVMQLLSEAAVLAAIGAVLSVPLAMMTLDLITMMIPEELATGLAVELSASALIFAALVSVLTTGLFGLAPALQAGAADPGPSISSGKSRLLSGSRLFGAGGILAMVQIGFSMVLLVLAALFSQSLLNVVRTNLGMDVGSLITFTISPRLNGYESAEVRSIYDRVEDGLRDRAEITSVTSSVIPLLTESAMGFQVSGPGYEWTPGADNFSFANSVTPGFFRTMGTSLLAGRDFVDSDGPDTPRVAIVNQRFVETFNLGNAVGQHFSIPYVIDDLEIVGVVADSKYEGVKSTTLPQFLTPRSQWFDVPALTYYVRSAIDADAIYGTIRQVVSSVAPDVPVSNMVTMETLVSENIYLDRLTSLLAGAFAAVASVLAAIGLYGVLAYSVTRRTRELGLRLALGATGTRLRVMVVRQVCMLAAIGGAAGLVAAIGVGRAFEALLFGVSGLNWTAFGAATVLLSIMMLIAGYLPARRASSVAPMEALRYE
jgi:putative ABC transport system permease protein